MKGVHHSGWALMFYKLAHSLSCLFGDCRCNANSCLWIPVMSFYCQDGPYPFLTEAQISPFSHQLLISRHLVTTVIDNDAHNNTADVACLGPIPGTEH